MTETEQKIGDIIFEVFKHRKNLIEARKEILAFFPTQKEEYCDHILGISSCCGRDPCKCGKEQYPSFMCKHGEHVKCVKCPCPCHKTVEEWKPTKEQRKVKKADEENIAEMLSWPRCPCHDKLVEHCPTERKRLYNAFFGKPDTHKEEPYNGWERGTEIPEKPYTREEIDDKINKVKVSVLHDMVSASTDERRRWRHELLNFMVIYVAATGNDSVGFNDALEKLREKFL